MSRSSARAWVGIEAGERSRMGAAAAATSARTLRRGEEKTREGIEGELTKQGNARSGFEETVQMSRITRTCTTCDPLTRKGFERAQWERRRRALRAAMGEVTMPRDGTKGGDNCEETSGDDSDGDSS